MARCQWDGCSVDVPPTVRERAPTYQRKYCDEHRIAACRLAGAKASGALPESTRKIDRHGYVHVRRKGGDGRGNWIAEHRVVMEGTLGRKLRRGESVHHKNGKRDDNRPENLELWVGPIRWGQRATDVVCPHCGKEYQ